MRILLIQPNSTYPKDIPLVVEMPLGLCYIAAVARQRGHDVMILDSLAEGYNNREVLGESITYGLSEEDIEKKIRASKPDVVGCSAMFTVQYHNVRKLCALVKRIDPGIRVVVGGMHATVQAMEVLSDTHIDYVLQGEADFTFSELVDALESNQDISSIDGIGFKQAKDGKSVIKPKHGFIGDLDRLPFPARDLLKIRKYYEAGLAHGFILKHRRNMNLITSRGCSGHCIFCTIRHLWGSKYRARSPENVLSELEEIKHQYGARHVQFEDDNLTFDIPRAKRIFKGMIDRRLSLAWNTPNGIAAWRMDTETLDLMKKSGCYFVKFAVESGNQRVLSEVIKKPQRLSSIIPLIKYARHIGLKVGSFFVVGLPCETRKEMQDTFDFPYKVHLDLVEVSIATPHYGTELRAICEAKGYMRQSETSNLYSRKASIQTGEFSVDWLESKVRQENIRWLRYIVFHQPSTFISLGWAFVSRNPLFWIGYLSGLLKGKSRGHSS